ncbi:hypothetical protein ACT4UM_00955 [Bacillus sp. SS-TM]
MHEVFGHPVTNTPTKLTEERAKIRASFMQEELEEFLEATTVEDQYDALIDLIYFAFGTFAMFALFTISNPLSGRTPISANVPNAK